MIINSGIMFTGSCLILTEGSESLPFEWTWEKLLLQTSLVHHGGVFVSYSCVRGGFVCDYRVSVQKLPEERVQIKAEEFRSDRQAMGGRGSAGWYRNQQNTQRYSPHSSTTRKTHILYSNNKEYLTVSFTFACTVLSMHVYHFILKMHMFSVVNVVLAKIFYLP